MERESTESAGRATARLTLRLGIIPFVAAMMLSASPLSAGDRDGDHDRDRAPPTPFLGPVPKPTCQPGDRTETGLDGQTTNAERMSGASTQPYNCNLEVVGQFVGEGADHQMGWQDECAFYSTNAAVAGTNGVPAMKFPGVQVIDASDPRHPFRTDNLADPSLTQPWESLNVNHTRKLLGGIEGEGGNGVHPGFSVYDISDCRHPVLKASIDLPNPAIKGHAGNFTPDGRTFYGVDISTSVYGIDISDPSNPTLIANTVFTDGIVLPHYITPNKDGTRGYIGNLNVAAAGVPPCTGAEKNGLVIVDLSDIQFRRPNPQVRTVSTLFWCDSTISEVSVPVKIGGKPFLVFTDELGSAKPASVACAANMPPWGFVRLIDISDEKNPKIAAKLILEVDDPANCSQMMNDNVGAGFGYDAHDCGVDNVEDAKLIACSHHQGGVRVFDIHDPYHPSEIAYYKGAARGTTGPLLPGSATSTTPNPTFAQAQARSRFVWKGDDLYLWLTSSESGLVVARFENEETIKALHLRRSPGNEEPNN
jgi:hypothetical protein